MSDYYAPVPVPDGNVYDYLEFSHAGKLVACGIKATDGCIVCTLADTAQSGNSVRAMNRWLGIHFGLLTQDLYAAYKPCGPYYRRECGRATVYLVGSEHEVQRFAEVWKELDSYAREHFAELKEFPDA